MGRLVVGMNLSLDGYVDHDRFAPAPDLFRHWIAHVETLAASFYGRRLYELMAWWDTDDPGWSAEERAFAAAWRRHPKWVFSRTLTEVGPNATLVRGEAAQAAAGLKAGIDGEIDAGGTLLARSLAEAGLVDEYRLYYHPVVLGSGTPFFAPGARPALRLAGAEVIAEGIARLRYVPA